jgi:hypothetical protein
VACVGVAVAVLVVRHDAPAQVTPVGPGASAPPPVDQPATVDISTPAATGASPPAPAPPVTVDLAPARSAEAVGAFSFASGYGPVLGAAGTLHRFKVAVETALGQGTGAGFADEIDRTLGDPRSWVAGRQFRLQRVPPETASEFTIYLASARTSERMCGAAGLSTDGFTSCRLSGQVIINSDRWRDAVPDYGAPLATYRAYAINHEVGHQFGHGHEACPGRGRPAPVMQQQTYGLQGCVANAWPYLDGKRYAGPPTP